MLIAASMTDWVIPAFFVIVGIAFYAGLGWAILRFYRWYRRLAQKDIEEAYAELKPYWPPGKGAVSLHFHTYCGFFVWVVETEHRVALPPKLARQFLGRLHHHNLAWGWFCPFIFAVPLLSLVHYWGQLRAIQHQAAKSPEIDDLYC